MLRKPARHPDHDARVALPDAHLARPRDARRRRVRDRRRDPRRRRQQARLAPGADARAAGGARARQRPRAPLQRIGLSATQRPIEEIARFLGGVAQPEGEPRPVTIVEVAGRQAARPRGGRAGRRPARSRDRSPAPHRRTSSPSAATPPAGARSGPASTRACSSWCEQHSSTIVFVNNRRLAERLALRLNDLAEEEVARSHHGSLSREARTEIEEELKAGKLRCLVATSSLELGIDMGAVDLVIQIESPKSVARGLQRIGRAGHTLSQAVSKGRIFPKFRADLRRVRRGRRSACARARSRRRRSRARRSTCSPSRSSRWSSIEDWSVDDLHRVVTGAYPVRGPVARRSSRTCSTCSTAAIRRRSSPSCGRGSSWDRIEGTLRARRGSQKLAVTNAGHDPRPRPVRSAPARRPARRRAGRGDGLRGARRARPSGSAATTWRIEEITRDRVIVTPAPEVPGAIPFWKGDGIGRPFELGEAIGAFQREVSEMPQRARARDCCDERLRPRRVRRRQPLPLPRRAARRHPRRCRPTARSWSSASATRSATGACAC